MFRLSIRITDTAADGSATRFAVTRMAPFRVKGKARPVQALSVGKAIGGRSRDSLVADRRFPLMGREREMATFEAALAGVREGGGRVLEVVGEPGVGKSRLLEELRGRAADLRGLQVTCEAYTATVAHAARNTEVPFMVLKHRVLNEGRSLAAAIRESKPDVDAAAEVNKARAQARDDLQAIAS